MIRSNCLTQLVCGKRVAAFWFLAICGLSGGFIGAESETQPAQTPVAANVGDPKVTELLEPIRQKFGVPALAGAIVTVDGLKTSGVVGVRKAGTDIPVTIDDQWHLGSDTKAMTAVLIAKLVEKKVMRWDMTVAEIFPEMKIHPDAQAITLTHLVNHRAGLPSNLIWSMFGGFNRNVVQQRLAAAQQGLAEKPKNPIGTVYEYSNLGYVIAGAMVERVTKSSWEKELQKEVFAPLGMDKAGFGGVGTPGKVDQPWGHTKKNTPVSGNGPKVDNAQVIGPAGVVNCSLADWSKFIADELRGEAGMKALLAKDSYAFLHSPPFGGEYAYGWGVLQRDWGGGKVLAHAGSNTMNYAMAWVAPKRGFAVIICCNQGDDEAATACDEAAGGLIGLYEQMNGAGRTK